MFHNMNIDDSYLEVLRTLHRQLNSFPARFYAS